MKYGIIYSRIFLEKVLSWPQDLQDEAFAAVNHLAENPNLKEYIRDKIVPYRQKIGISDGQMKLYFFLLPNAVYIAWINDKSCPHNTFNVRTDPCHKEWERLLNNGDIKPFDPKTHILFFEVDPRATQPFRSRSTYLGKKIVLAASPDPENKKRFVAHAFHCEEDFPGIDLIHTKEFLRELGNHLTNNKTDFEIRLVKNGLEREVDLLTSSHDPATWRIIPDDEDFILEKI